MAFISINEAKVYLENEIKKAEGMFESLPVSVKGDVSTTYNDTEAGEELIAMFGAVSISTEELEENEIVFLSLDAEVIYSPSTDTAVVDTTLLDERRDEFFARLSEIRTRLEGSDNVSATIRELNKEMDEQLQKEYEEMLEKLNASSRSNLKFALICTAALLLVAAICIAINLIF